MITFNKFIIKIPLKTSNRTYLSSLKKVVSLILVILLTCILVPKNINATDDYPWPASDYNQLSPLKFNYRNCTDFVAWRLNKQLGAVGPNWLFTWSTLGFPTNMGHAIDWKDYAAAKNYKVDNTPKKGSVAWWGASRGPLGHVAIVEAVNDGGTVNVEQYNYGTSYVYSSEANVTAEAYLHIADISDNSDTRADFNKDGRDDLAWYQNGTIFNLRSLGNGTFGNAGSTTGIGTPTWAGTGDFIGNDGKAEIVWYQGTTIYIFDANTNGTFSVYGTTLNIGTPTWAGVGDFNNDGKDDLAWYQNGSIVNLRSLGNGSFGVAGWTNNIGTPTWAGAGDFNSDGRDDLAWYQNGLIFNLRSLSNGTFGNAGSTAPSVGAPIWAGTGDFIGNDGKAEIVWYTAEGNITTYDANANGTFTNYATTSNIGVPTWAGRGSYPNTNGK